MVSKSDFYYVLFVPFQWIQNIINRIRCNTTILLILLIYRLKKKTREGFISLRKILDNYAENNTRKQKSALWAWLEVWTQSRAAVHAKAIWCSVAAVGTRHETPQPHTEIPKHVFKNAWILYFSTPQAPAMSSHSAPNKQRTHLGIKPKIHT